MIVFVFLNRKRKHRFDCLQDILQLKSYYQFMHNTVIKISCQRLSDILYKNYEKKIENDNHELKISVNPMDIYNLQINLSKIAKFKKNGKILNSKRSKL